MFPRIAFPGSAALAFVASLALTLGAFPASAQVTGERALLNRTDAKVVIAAPQAPKAQRPVDGQQALLNRTDRTVTPLIPATVPGSALVTSAAIDGRRALLGSHN